MALLLAGWPAVAAALDLTIGPVPSSRGTLRISICDRETFLRDCRYKRLLPAAAGRVVVRLEDVPTGRYAVLAHHDENGDGRVDRNLLGIPTEAVGFSNDPAVRFGPPDFEDAAVDLTDRTAPLSITLRR